VSGSLRLLPAALYAAAIFYGGLMDVREVPKLALLSPDKVLHLLAFLGLEMLLELGFSNLSKAKRRSAAVLLSVVLGAALEGVQAALPYRSAEFLDLVADALGALTGALLLAVIGRWFGARSASAPGASS
jgi:glycopeptide antibiotics resistance protein